MRKKVVAGCRWLMDEWHPKKNIGLDPGQICVNSTEVVWWYMEYTNPDSGEIFPFEWQAEVRSRYRSHSQCPYLTGNAIWPGFNDLKTCYPEIAAQWHPERNGNLTPDKVQPYTNLEVWWLFPYDDPRTGRHFDFVWKASIKSRTAKKCGCPYLTNKRLWKGYNDLATMYPELALQWNAEKNGMGADEVMGATKKKRYWWIWYYQDEFTGNTFPLEWEDTIDARVKGIPCPYLDGRAVHPGFNDLATRYPEIALEWHPYKNGDLTPDQVYFKTAKKVWWYKKYWDPILNKEFEFSWEGKIYNRTIIGVGCPYLSGHAVLAGFNDLATRFPNLAKEWDYEKNGDLTPEQVMPGSRKIVHWKITYLDPKSNTEKSLEWKASCQRRTKGIGCPYLSNNKVLEGFNDLATTHPQLAAQWHPDKNGSLQPTQVTYGSQEKVWWCLNHFDKELGKEFCFEWLASPNARTNKDTDCPFLSNRALWVGFNDLQTRYPDIASEWNYEKNGQLTPDQVIATTNTVVWWQRDYTDPETGKVNHLEWKSAVSARTRWNRECPYLTNTALLPGFNDLQTRYPHIAAQWHPEKNGDLKPSDVFSYDKRSVWWIYPYDDPNTGRHFDFEWECVIQARVANGTGCPYLSGAAVWIGFNDLATTNPDLAAQWHPFKNGELTPQQVSAGSRISVWWYLPYTDPKTGILHEFEWEAEIYSRVYGNGCPYLSGAAVWVGYNDLTTTHPEVAARWHPFKNGELTPQQVSAGSNQMVWWYLPYTDPATGTTHEFEWFRTVGAQVNALNECPYLAGFAVWVGYNDLATTHPEVAARWHPTKNGELTPETVTSGSSQSVWWYLPYTDPATGITHEFEWIRTVVEQVNALNECPYLAGHAVWTGFNDLATTHPEVAARWHPTKNGELTPETVMSGSSQLVWWYLPYTDQATGITHEFEWIRTVKEQVNALNECPYLAGRAVWPGFNDLQTCYPSIAEQWADRNKSKRPDQVYKFSRIKVWWHCPECENEWKTAVRNRTVAGTGCPVCAKNKRNMPYID